MNFAFVSIYIEHPYALLLCSVSHKSFVQHKMPWNLTILFDALTISIGPKSDHCLTWSVTNPVSQSSLRDLTDTILGVNIHATSISLPCTSCCCQLVILKKKKLLTPKESKSHMVKQNKGNLSFTSMSKFSSLLVLVWAFIQSREWLCFTHSLKQT